jgi:hypothetical protein
MVFSDTMIQLSSTPTLSRYLGYNREQLPHAGVVKWLDTTPEASQFVRVLTLAEIEKGILRKEDGKRRRDLQRWFDEDLPARFAGRILASSLRCTGRVLLGSTDRIAA